MKSLRESVIEWLADTSLWAHPTAAYHVIDAWLRPRDIADYLGIPPDEQEDWPTEADRAEAGDIQSCLDVLMSPAEVRQVLEDWLAGRLFDEPAGAALASSVPESPGPLFGGAA